EREVGGRVSACCFIAFAALTKLLEGVLADRDEHPKPRFPLDLRLSDEAVLDERAEDVQRVATELGSTDGLDLREHPAGHEDAEPREELTLRRVEQIPAPVDRTAKSALTVRDIAGRGREHVESLSQFRQHRLRRQDLDSCG